MTVPNQSIALRQRLHRASLRCAQLEGARQSDIARQTELTQEVAAAKGRALLAEEISRIFDALQKRAHERSVGAFERLLSAILQDVLPEEGKVRLLPTFKANTTWLDVALEKGGALEDVIDGNGGAVTNVVCAGLRYAALLRTSNRRLMILDEPDCWLKPERVPAFVRVVSQVAAQTQTQTFFITHHDIGLFDGQVNVVRFTAAEDGSDRVLAVAHAPTVTQWEDDDTPGIRAIELMNFRRHVHTFVPCFPGATAYIGDNNLGKSTAIVSSFKAVAYGESDDSMIRHGCEEARIVLHLEKGRKLEWSRSNKRTHTVIYRLYEAGNPTPVQEGRPKTRNQAPDWVVSLLGVSRVDDLDVQVGNQKSPVFLLNDSAPRRAQILSVGKESGHLKSLMKRYEEQKSADREVTRQGEAQLTRLAYRIGRMAALDATSEKLAELVIESDELLTGLEKLESLQRIVAKLEDLEGRVAQHSRVHAVLSGLPELPTLQDTAALERLTSTMTRREELLARAKLPEMVLLPELADVQLITQMGQRLAALQRRVDIGKLLPAALPELPAVLEVEQLSTAITRLSRRQDLAATREKEYLEADQQVTRSEAELARLKSSLGEECPLCGNPLSEVSPHAHSHESTHDHLPH